MSTNAFERLLSKAFFRGREVHVSDIEKRAPTSQYPSEIFVIGSKTGSHRPTIENWQRATPRSLPRITRHKTTQFTKLIDLQPGDNRAIPDIRINQ